jgi:mannose/cellobiose epimerase-like protein (N-acyl-D-glucosamine 2-epimerase family)
MASTLTPGKDWRRAEARRLISFFGRASVHPDGGFYGLRGDGTPILTGPRGKGALRELFSTCRMVHCFAAAQVMDVPGADAIVDHGMQYLWEGLRDADHGGYMWSADDAGPVNSDKMAYGHAFVLLAAASAHEVGHPDATRLRDDVTNVLKHRFWEETAGAMQDEFRRDWSVFSQYRGQNSNMHMVEALMAAYEAWGEATYLSWAERIADLIINRHARAADWVVIEHFDTKWQVDRAFDGDPMFRPPGTTPGHALEWARLCIQLWHLGGRRLEWLEEAAKALFHKAVETGWSAKGGFVYTLDLSNEVAIHDRFWWPACEGAAAASSLFATTGDAFYADWHARIWDVIKTEFIDDNLGGWWPEANGTETVFVGKPDIYHALQACLLPDLPPSQSLLSGLKGVF